MSTVQPAASGDEKPQKNKQRPEDGKKKVVANTLFVVVAIIILMSMVKSCDGPSDNTSEPTTPTSETTSTSATTSTKAAPTTTEIANLAEGVDPKMGPQEWFNEDVYKANNCASQNLAFGGLPICAIRGIDTDHGGTMLVGYIDQDEAGVQDHFAQKQRRDMMVEAFAERVGQAKHEGDPRVQHVTDVRIIASGGKGLGSGWQGEAKVF